MKTDFIQVVNNETPTLSSMEVAEMVEKQHNEVLKSIRKYTEYFNEGKIPLVDFWTSDTYTDGKGETRPCYLITKKGCEFIAHKTTGAKGTIFTARYINRFHEMEKALNSPTAITDNRLEIARLIIQAPESRVSSIRELYPEYFSVRPEVCSLEYMSDLNTSYTKWIEDYGITKEWIGDFPTGDIYLNYVRYCTENRLIAMGKKLLYQTLERDFNLTRKQRANGHRYFLSA